MDFLEHLENANSAAVSPNIQQVGDTSRNEGLQHVEV